MNCIFDHRRGDMITKIANVEYNSQADCPMWKNFIREIMDFKPELVNSLQTATGWVLTGDTSEQTLFIMYGNGANGKTTFLNFFRLEFYFVKTLNKSPDRLIAQTTGFGWP